MLVPERAGQPGADSRRAHRRGGAAVPGHHVDRLLGRRARQRAHRRRGRGVRAGPDRPVRDGGRAARAARRWSSASTACRSRLEFAQAHGRRRRASTTRSRTSVAEIKRLTGGGVDVAIEALGTQATFENALRCVRPGGTLSSLGVYSGHLHGAARRVRGRPRRPHDRHDAVPGRQGADAAADEHRRAPSAFRSATLVTHPFRLDEIEAAYDLFAHQRDGVMKVAIRP